MKVKSIDCKSVWLKFFIVFVFTIVFTKSTAQKSYSYYIPIETLKTERINPLPFSKVFQTDKDLDAATVDNFVKQNKLTIANPKASQGFSQNFFWIQFKIDWQNINQDIVLELDNPHVDQVKLYQKVNDEFLKIGFGGDRNRTFKDRSYINRRYIFPLKNTNSITTYYLLVDKRNASVSFPLWLWNKGQFEAVETKQNVYFGIFFGVIFFLGIVSLLIGVFIKNKMFLYYAGYTLSMCLYLFTALGFSFQFLYPNSENFNNYSRVILSVIIAVFTTLFLRVFLNIDKNLPKISKYYKIVSAVLVVLTVLWMFFSELYQVHTIWLLNISNVLFLSIFIGAFCAAFYALKTNRYNAIVFFMAFGVMIFGILMYLGIEYGLINEDIFPLNPMLLGSGFEIIILSFAMIYQLSKIILAKQVLEIKHQTLVQNTQTLEAKNLELINTAKTLKKQHTEKKSDTILLKSKALIKLNEITHISSDGHYLEFYLTTKETPEVDRNTIKAVLSQLPEIDFAQVHRSHIVNINHLKIIKASELILKNGRKLPISRSFKTQIKELVINSQDN